MKTPEDWHFVKNGGWILIPTKKPGRIGCCDCGLVHRVIGRVRKDGRIQMAVLRDEQETARVRQRLGWTLPRRPRRTS